MKSNKKGALLSMKAKKILISVILIITLVGVYGLNVFANTEKRASNIKSKGVFSYENGKVILDASDLTYLAEEIDLLEEKYKECIVSGLGNISSYYDISGDVVHESPDMSLVAKSVPFASLYEAISNSQEIYNEGNTYTNEVGEPYYKAPDGSLTVDSTIENAEALDISAASANNLSAGAAAWVDGELIIGTGVDNKAYADYWYSKGIADGLSKANVDYVYHKHVDGNGNPSNTVLYTTTNPGGCYVSGGHTHNKTSTCSTQTVKQDRWYSSYYVDNGDGGGYQQCGCGECSYRQDADMPFSHNHPVSTTVYSCGNPPNTWKIGCGKTEQSIEYATIKFD